MQGLIQEIGAVVYAFRAGNTNRYKIGRAQNVETRRKQLQTGCPDELELVGTIEGDAARIETDLHQMFSEYRTTGEWFEFEDPWLIHRLFRPASEADTRALEFLVFSSTDIRVTVEGHAVYDNQTLMPVLRFCVTPVDQRCDHPFFAYFQKERRQKLHKSPILAVADYVDAFSVWPGRTEYLKKIGETCHVGKKCLDFACPRCRQPFTIHQ